MTLVQWLILLAGSLALLWLSRGALRRPGCHGFYRFFVFESILLLAILNGEYWFVDRYSPLGLLSWALLFIALYLVLAGLWLLLRHGRPGPERTDDTLLEFEKTQVLVTRGIYRWIRHPMYSSLIWLAWGVFFKHPTVAGAGLAVLASFCAAATARAEERECLAFFGAGYADYMATTRRFIPGLF